MKNFFQSGILAIAFAATCMSTTAAPRIVRHRPAPKVKKTVVIVKKATARPVKVVKVKTARPAKVVKKVYVVR